MVRAFFSVVTLIDFVFLDILATDSFNCDAIFGLTETEAATVYFVFKFFDILAKAYKFNSGISLPFLTSFFTGEFGMVSVDGISFIAFKWFSPNTVILGGFLPLPSNLVMTSLSVPILWFRSGESPPNADPATDTPGLCGTVLLLLYFFFGLVLPLMISQSSSSRPL